MKSEMTYAAHSLSRAIPHSVKRPLETRIWYKYPDQLSSNPSSAGTGTEPSEIARVLEGGATQSTQITYNSKGMVTARTDPVGRQTTYVYDSNGIDLLEVRQTKPGGYDVLATYDDYTADHQPQTMTDAAGQTTAMTYNAVGQPLTVTNALDETTTYAYQTSTGYLTSVTGPVSGATTTYSYDDFGRIETVTDVDDYSVSYEYDNLNRMVRTTYLKCTGFIGERLV
jgi:YD repeat-containing protein